MNIHEYAQKCYKHLEKDMNKSKLNAVEKLEVIKILIELMQERKDNTKIVCRLKPMCEHCKYCSIINNYEGKCLLKYKYVYLDYLCRKYEQRHYEPMAM